MTKTGWHDVVHDNQCAVAPPKLEIEQHLTFLSFSPDGALLLGSSSLADRIQTGSIWMFSEFELPLRASNCTAKRVCDSPVTSGAFVTSDRLVVAEHNGLLVSYQLCECDSDSDEASMNFIPIDFNNVHDSIISSVSVCCQRETIITGGDDRRINLLDLEGAVKTSYFPAHSRAVASVAASPEHSSVFASCSMDRSVLLWDTRLPRPAKAIVSGDCGYSALAWLDDRQIAVGSEMGAVHTYDVRTVQPLAKRHLHEMPIHKLASRSGFIASCADSSEIQVWQPDLDKVLSLKTQHTMFARDVAWHPKKPDLFSCGFDGAVFSYRID
ncbi:WD domain, G-beta repeat [Nesidiocoris tenuis]|uniref:WD domain, G-beta repeat n=1 Tax=Nesidiocoris tenuis TaxID=355587 RepID=A0ABN7BE62_9HEMI|nr:WD domain, G-beta repeat [Nesidiocoris tenuis]